ncbi:aldehyde dehydrogenase family protein [Algisphaera agarilytica]|uniref:Lactaldehyde dehydrogenase/glycolaldehyde dehydrogenase n=1 Tax=Algisphaera agarilytica TaxID=1385975 RepID=A0A7X0H8G2_9BACT|nr:aldehyde dehydrogenase family protein [Algisphaera agarilytica]MBB6431210.1 lactaldehyde dehydrogenase/glycolaldehyde dehydrogenase [Algisphaera agarilytica]
MTTAATQVDAYRCYIHGQWVESETGQTIEVKSPATGQVWATVPACSKAQAQQALESSQEAQPAWAALPAQDRAVHLLNIAKALEAEHEHFSKLLVMEQGKTLPQARGEVTDTIRYITYNAEAARRIQGEIFPSDMADESLWITRVPFGVTVGLCAFNYPLALIGRKLAPALVTGNTMVLKPHDETPVTASEFMRLVHDAGLPAGVVNMVSGGVQDVGSTLVESPITKLVSVTGSIPAGRAIYAGGAKNLTQMTLELGGKAPFIILDDVDDLDAIVDAAVIARYANCGQVCICNEMALVHEKIADEFTEKFIKKAKEVTVGDPMDESIGMGPYTTKGGMDRFHGIVQESIKQGAELALGGDYAEVPGFEGGNWYQPTVLTNATKDTAAVAQEVFGPVLPIVKISGYEEAAEMVNSRDEGLSAYLWTTNHKTIMHATRTLEVGTVFVNKGICGYIQGYHTGHKHSGIGGEDGVHGIEGFLQKRTIYLGNG